MKNIKPDLLTEEELEKSLTKITSDEIAEAKKRMALSSGDIALSIRDKVMSHADSGTPYISDREGNKYLDFTSQAWTLSHGFNDPDIVAATTLQASLINHLRSKFLTIPRLKLVRKLSDIAPGNLKKVALSTQGGSIANEVAMKIAMVNKPEEDYVFLTTWGGYHGTSLTTHTSSFYEPMGMRFHNFAMDRFAKVPYPYCYRCPFGHDSSDCNLECLTVLEKTINRGVSKSVNSVIIEPMQGAGGNVPAPKKYMKGLRKVCDENNVYLIFDEAQTAFGRIGTMFAAEYYETVPDIMSLAKSLGGGVPIGATLMGEDMEALEQGEQHSTFSANPVSFAGALINLELIERKNLPQRAKEMGEYFMKRLHEMQEKYELIGDVRGVGLFIGVEFVEDRETKKSATAETAEIVEECMKRGLILDREAPVITRSGDMRWNVIPIKPPLIISKEDADKGLDILEDAIREASDVFEIPYSTG